MTDDTKRNDVALSTWVEQAYLEYAMYVILDRALPFIGDGLKPVQRRVLYAMRQLGIRHDGPYRKAARTVGETIGRYHPHGDAATYASMVLMAQSFSVRYPMVDGHGNWGSVDDPGAYAAMRYTEARLTPYGALLLSELGPGTTEFVETFDASTTEPVAFPAPLPNVLLQGTVGIAVGMSTSIPPHNAGEVIDACCLLLKNKHASLEEILELIQGPDLPTGATVVCDSGVLTEAYRTGTGQVHMRAVHHIEEDRRLIFTALPWQSTGRRVVSEIADVVDKEVIPGLLRVSDESDHAAPVRIAVEFDPAVTSEAKLLKALYARTGLQRELRIHLNVIVTGRTAKVCGLLEILQEWLEWRIAIVVRRSSHRITEIDRRRHQLAALLRVLADLDTAIAIIREADEPDVELQRAFDLDAEQAKTVLDMRLRQLRRLEELKLQKEDTALAAERAQLESLLASPARQRTAVKRELLAVKKAVDVKRRSQIIDERVRGTSSRRQSVPKEPITIMLSRYGWMRAGKGHMPEPQVSGWRRGDAYLHHAYGRLHLRTSVLTADGRTFAVDTTALPSARGNGEPLSALATLDGHADFVGVANGQPDDEILVASARGRGLRCTMADVTPLTKRAKRVMTHEDHDVCLAPLPINPDGLVALLDGENHLLIVAAQDISPRKSGKGVKLMQLPATTQITHLAFIPANGTLVIHAAKRFVRIPWTSLTDDWLRGRATRGLPISRFKIGRPTDMSVEPPAS